MKSLVKKIMYSAKAFLTTWRSDFPNMGQMVGSHIVSLPNGQPAISLTEAVRRGAWLYKDEPKIPGAKVWNSEVRKAR